jgi:hypothetical protein
MTSTSTCDDSEELISLDETLDAAIAAKVMECLSATCDTDMLTESYHHFSDDTVIVDADAGRICAVDAAADVSPTDWLINLPLNLWERARMALSCVREKLETWKSRWRRETNLYESAMDICGVYMGLIVLQKPWLKLNLGGDSGGADDVGVIKLDGAER